MKSLSIPAVLSLLPLLSFVGSTQAGPQFSEQTDKIQAPISEVNENELSGSETPAEIEALKAEAQPLRAEQPTTQAERPEVPLTVPLYDLTDPRHSFHGNCPACGMG